MTTSLNVIELEQKINALQSSRQLEQGRNEVLRMVAKGNELKSILQVLCEKAQIYRPDMLCSILRLEEKKGTLHPIASVSLPQSYCDALDGVTIGIGVGSCGTAAYTQKRVIVEDINTHPYWSLYKELALNANLQACWSEPIIGANGKVFGTFGMYYHQPTTPTDEDLQFIEVSANLAAVVFDNEETRQKLIDANKLLNLTIDERNQELEKKNIELASMLNKQHELHLNNIYSEKMLTTKSLISGFAFEVSKPIGFALTGISTAQSQLKKITTDFHIGKLTRKTMTDKSEILIDAISLTHNNLSKASNLLTKFNDISFDLNHEQAGAFKMSDLFNELEGSLIKLTKKHSLIFETDDISLPHSKDALWQIFYQLIENTVVHGFLNSSSGSIYITAIKDNGRIIIYYQDDGCGISAELHTQVFEPFFSTKQSDGYIGLGLNLVSNILNNIFSGKIRLLPTPVGVRYEITIPTN